MSHHQGDTRTPNISVNLFSLPSHYPFSFPGTSSPTSPGLVHPLSASSLQKELFNLFGDTNASVKEFWKFTLI